MWLLIPLSSHERWKKEIVIKSRSWCWLSLTKPIFHQNKTLLLNSTTVIHIFKALINYAISHNKIKCWKFFKWFFFSAYDFCFIKLLIKINLGLLIWFTFSILMCKLIMCITLISQSKIHLHVHTFFLSKSAFY